MQDKRKSRAQVTYSKFRLYLWNCLFTFLVHQYEEKQEAERPMSFLYLSIDEKKGKQMYKQLCNRRNKQTNKQTNKEPKNKFAVQIHFHVVLCL